MIDEEKTLKFLTTMKSLLILQMKNLSMIKKEDELYNSITKDGSSVDPADDGERHIRPEDGDPIEVEE